MPRLDRHDLGGLVFHDTTIAVFDVDRRAQKTKRDASPLRFQQSVSCAPTTETGGVDHAA